MTHFGCGDELLMSSQVQMFVLLGNKLMKEGDYEGAIKLFKCAQFQSSSQNSPHLNTISLVSDHNFVVSMV
jgi:hypothetical protein